MNKKDFDTLHIELEKITERGRDKDNYTLIHYADVAVMIDRVYNKNKRGGRA